MTLCVPSTILLHHWLPITFFRHSLVSTSTSYRAFLQPKIFTLVWEANSKMVLDYSCCCHKQHHCAGVNSNLVPTPPELVHANWVPADWPIPGGHRAFPCAGVHISRATWAPRVPVEASRCSCNKGCWEESDWSHRSCWSRADVTGSKPHPGIWVADWLSWWQ